MENINDRIEKAQATLNRCRNEITTPGVGRCRRVVGHREQGSPGYRPSVTGFVTMLLEEFHKLPKTKVKKLMKA